MKRFLYLTIMVLSTIFGQAQQIIIKDAQTGTALSGATITLGSSTLQSNINGEVTLPTLPGGNMLLCTHVLYEPLQLKTNGIKQLIHTGVLYMQPKSATPLQPVTVFALRSKANPVAPTQLTQTDWIQHDAGQVLDEITGFSAIRKSGAYAADPVFRGFKYGQLNILTDGALTGHAACPNRMDPPTSQIMINQIEKIEVLKGPYSFRYGPAMGAVIQFKSAEPRFTGQKETFGRLNAGYETNGEIYRSEAVAGFRQKNLEVSALGSYSTGHNYKSGNGTLVPAGFSRGAAGLQAAYKPGQRDIFAISVVRNFARNTRFPTLMMDLLTDDTWLVQTSWSRQANNSWYSNWKIQAYTSVVDHTMGNHLRTTVANSLNFTAANTLTWGGRNEWEIRSKNLTIYTGFDFKQEYVDGYRTRSPKTGAMAGKTFTDTVWQDGTIQSAGIFGEAIYKPGKVAYTLALRTDRIVGKASNAAYRYKNMFTLAPQIDVNLSLSAGLNRRWPSGIYTGLWVGRGTRSTSIPERFINFLAIGQDPYEMIGNPLLKPEINYQTDWQIGYKKHNTTLEMGVFYSKVYNYISSVIDKNLKPQMATSPGVRRFVNLDAAERWGGEATWLQKWTPWLSQAASLSFVWAQQLNLRQPLPEIPPMELRYRLEATLLKGSLKTFAGINYTAAQKRIAPQFGESTTPDYALINAGCHYTITKSFDVSINVNNVFDKNYREHLTRFITAQSPLWATGRNIVAMATFRF